MTLPVVPHSFETERLVIRAPRISDAAEVNAAVRESLDELRPWMPWAKTAPTLEETRRNMRTARRHFLAGRDLRLQLFLKGTNTFVGGSGLHRIDWSVPKFEIGYWCRTRFQGQGFITEAVRGITTFAFETLEAQRVEIRCDANNLRSRAVAERAGFPLEATLRNNARALDGSLRSTLVFAMTRENYGQIGR